MKMNGILLIGFVSSLALAAPKKGPLVVDPSQSVPRGQAKRLLIEGFAGSVTILPAPSGSDSLQVKVSKSGDGEDPSVTEDYLKQYIVRANNIGDTVEIKALPPGGTSEWLRWVHGHHLPECHLDIWAPATMNVEVFWSRGEVRVSRWKAPTFISSQEGHIDIEGAQNDVTVRTVTGSLKIADIKGSVSVENFASSVSVTDVTGKVRARTFSGETSVKKVTGSVTLATQKGALHTQETQGGMDVQSGLAPVHVVDHKGAFISHSDGGSVSVQIKGPVEARMVSKTGSVNLSVSRDSHASVNLSTKGQLNAPREMEKNTGPDSKVIQGDLRGSVPGHIRLLSDTGDVSLRIF